MKSKAKSQQNTPIKQSPDPNDPHFISECFSKSLDAIEISVRTANALKHANIRTIGELAQNTVAELLAMGIGRKSLLELEEILAEMGLSLGWENTPIKQSPDPNDPYFILECLSKSIDEIEMSVRTANGLLHANIRTIGQLVQKTEEELLAGKALGPKSVFELKEVLAEMSLSLGMDLRTMQFNSEKDSEKSQFVAIGLLGNRLKLFSFHRDGRFVFLDKISTYGGVYVITSETLRLKQAVEELETLINVKNVREEDLQEFFEKNQEFILNDEYKKAHSKVVLQKDKRGSLVPDFILEPYNPERLCDILDLKLPSAKVWILKKNRPRFSYAVLEAVAQLREYSHFFEEEDNRSKILQEYGLLAYKPKLFVIIGRRGPVTPLVRRRIEIGTPDTTVLTYDDIIEKIRQTIFLTRKGKSEMIS